MKIDREIDSIFKAYLQLQSEQKNKLNSESKIYSLIQENKHRRPPSSFVSKLESLLRFSKSYQVAEKEDFDRLNYKVLNYFHRSRKKIPFSFIDELKTIGLSGHLQCLFLLTQTIIKPNSHVLIIGPISPEIIYLFKNRGIKTTLMNGLSFQSFAPDLDDIKKVFEIGVDFIYVQSPNDLTGLHFHESWMEGFSGLLGDYPSIQVISDESFFETSYYDPGPSYYYQFNEELLFRTIVICNLSHVYSVYGPELVFIISSGKNIDAIEKVSHLIQCQLPTLFVHNLLEQDFSNFEEINEVSRIVKVKNVNHLRDCLQQNDLFSLWYQTTSGRNFLLDISKFVKADQDIVSLAYHLMDKHNLIILPGSLLGATEFICVNIDSDNFTFRESFGHFIEVFLDSL